MTQTNNKPVWFLVFIWILITASSICALAFGLESSPYLILILVLGCGFASANQDLVLDGLRLLNASKENLAMHNTWFLSGYRLGLLLAGGLSLIIADHFNWNLAYGFCGSLLLLGSLGLITPT